MIEIKIVEVDVPGLTFGLASSSGIVGVFGDRVVTVNGDDFRILKENARIAARIREDAEELEGEK